MESLICINPTAVQWAAVLVLGAGLLGYSVTGAFVWIIRNRVISSIEKATGVSVKDPWRDPNAPHWFVAELAGLVERIFFTIVVATGLTGVAPAMIAWIGIKGIVHWQVFKDDLGNQNIAFSFIGVLGTMVSLLVAIACGVYLKNLP